MTMCVKWTMVAAVAGLTVVSCAGPTSMTNQAVVPPDSAPLEQVSAPAEVSPVSRQAGLEQVALFSGPMPTGITVSRENRIFLSFPRWGDPVKDTVAELRNGQLIGYPNDQINGLNMLDAKDTLVSVQSVVVDSNNRLWVLDSGNINMGANLPGGPKLVCVDLVANQVMRMIHFPDTVAKQFSYLNDVRVDMRRGRDGTAYITDSSGQGQNGIVVVDLATGRSWRKLDGDKSVLPEPNFVPTVEGQPLMMREPMQPEKPLSMGSDGIALSPDGSQLYWRPLAGHHLYSISTDLLANENSDPAQVSAGVKDHGDLGFASDGMYMDKSGQLYLTDYEHHAIRRGEPNSGQFEVLVSDPRLIWPDTLSMGPDGYLYVTVNQLDRQPRFHGGQDLRKPPYALFRVRTQGGAFVQER